MNRNLFLKIVSCLLFKYCHGSIEWRGASGGGNVSGDWCPLDHLCTKAREKEGRLWWAREIHCFMYISACLLFYASFSTPLAVHL